MKVFDNKNSGKSWALQLNSNAAGEASLNAVDSITGEPVATLIDFSSTGKIIVLSKAREVLEEEGYDPYEHGNTWSADGRLFLEH